MKLDARTGSGSSKWGAVIIRPVLAACACAILNGCIQQYTTRSADNIKSHSQLVAEGKSAPVEYPPLKSSEDLLSGRSQPKQQTPTNVSWEPDNSALAFEFRGHNLGEGIDKFTRAACSTGTDSIFCFERKASIGTANVEIYYQYIGGKLAAIGISFEPKDYEYLKAAFTEKYGKPASVERSVTHNRMGAEFHDEETVWRLPAGRWVMERYATRIDQGNAIIVASAAAPVYARIQKANVENAVKDL